MLWKDVFGNALLLQILSFLETAIMHRSRQPHEALTKMAKTEAEWRSSMTLSMPFRCPLKRTATPHLKIGPLLGNCIFQPFIFQLLCFRCGFFGRISRSTMGAVHLEQLIAAAGPEHKFFWSRTSRRSSLGHLDWQYCTMDQEVFN